MRPLTGGVISSQRGFTLVEMLVVLVLISAASAFVGPNLWNSYEKFSQQSVVEAFMAELNLLRVEAYRQRKVIEFDRIGERNLLAGRVLPTLPDGWLLEKSSPLRFLPSGVTNGGVYQLKSANRRWLLEIAPLDGNYTIRLL